MITPDEFYTQDQRKLQQQFESEALADTVVAAIVRDEIEVPQAQFIESRDFFFLSTVSDEGEPTVSYKGGATGFVKVLDSKTLMFPNYDGNGMFKSMGNILSRPKIGMLFIDFETPNRVRVQGSATLSFEDDDLGYFPGATLVVRVDVSTCFLNCARYIHKHYRHAQSPYIPSDDGSQPHPSWKRIDVVQASLPEGARKRTREEGGTITFEDYVERLQAGES
ncbi:pyridoxamine 5'-phosphate oxidase family protein [Novosphingobium pentaromativorans]|uniref:Pyridoxamine 5'-phosphate oxidase-related, FMN-binding protein n=1 Tax=Novosphingobium pentaromativorans US6-1 TaxID=1088721 RepID=G6EFK7_9SPHN|nr:pyridoxamine 5'-phosphate oxidase family protein [Novosphingobium pentaromativorans]AIT81854.1 pyridoxamine 5'-phosphate oxidase [Novosphingobium pentaromativorans US6-1]EHJ59915.1 pyridoxamine 5'-phosphate oxidase-related, FMN-binding protein [Novosphingobium pentaromativorans US6-1]